ncbi:MAG: cofilin [Vezdaea aestivalis]|nr:MAG: cofilin [Vezdaea aestivalis]
MAVWSDTFLKLENRFEMSCGVGQFCWSDDVKGGLDEFDKAVSTEAIEAFNEMKLKKTHKWIIYKLSDDKKQVIIEKTSDKDDYEDFRSNLNNNAPRYAIYDMEYKMEDSGIRQKIIFIAWSSDEAKVMEKMLYSSSKEAVRKALNGIGAEVQANDQDDLEKESIIDRLKKGKA